MREKEIVNVIDGKKLGRILDLVLTLQGQIVGIVAPGERHFFKNIATNDSLFIPWKCIKKIGEDTILVEMNAPINPPNNQPCSDGCMQSRD